MWHKNDTTIHVILNVHMVNSVIPMDSTTLISINLRGTVFLVPKWSLEKAPRNSPLSLLSKESCHYIKATDQFYFDRSPIVFEQILDYLSRGELHIPNHVCSHSVKTELDFWGIPISSLHKCCWKVFYRTEKELSILEKLVDCFQRKYLTNISSTSSRFPRWRYNVLYFMEAYPTSFFAKVFLFLQYLCKVSTRRVFWHYAL